MHVLVADPMTAETRAGLEGLGLIVTYAPDIEPQTLPERAPDADVLIVGRTRVTRRTIEAGERLRAILRAGVGVDTIDVQAASERGILVADCKDADVSARAELAFGLVLALDRGLHLRGNAVEGPRKDGEAWTEGLGLSGRTFGLLGWDAIAQSLARIAHGFGMRVLVSAKGLTGTLAAEAGVHWCESPDALFGRVDVLSLHPEDGTDARATAARIASLAEGATLVVVTGRDLVDFAAAKARLAAGTLKLALDVYDKNDYDDDVPFAADAFPGLYASYRAGARTRQVEEAINHQVVSALERFLSQRVMLGTKNLGGAKAPSTLLIRHKPGPEVLSAVFDALKEAGANVLGLESHAFEGGLAALLRVGLAAAPSVDLRDELERLSGVMGLEVQ